MLVEGDALRRWTLCLLVVTGLICTASVSLYFTVRGSSWHDLFSYFHLAGEFNIAAYWNSLLLGLVSAAALFSGLAVRPGRTRWGWFVVSAVTFLMSVDEATQLHERTSELVSHIPLPTFSWVLIGTPLAILLFAVMFFATRTLPARMRRRLGFAIGLYVLGALGFEVLSGFAWRQQRPTLAEGFGTIEEALEMVACVYALHIIARSWLPLHVSVRGRTSSRSAAPAERAQA